MSTEEPTDPLAPYRAIPITLWAQMTGRSRKVIYEQAARYGWKCGSSPVSLPDFLESLHDWVAKIARRLSVDETNDPLLSGSESPALEEYRKERALLARMDRLEREGAMVSREALRPILLRVASLFRERLEQAERQYGRGGACELISEGIDDVERELSELLRGGGNGDCEPGGAV